ncbi:pleckstrin homology domain-containing family M member 2-like isoform X1 [Mytilus trossulus]|uniref:pleckstrin homology domain-containing family M member 2-like isoform X1 n=1 Tax=Mytilus trossulus TaxID=6551 RepID=UPI00300463D9
MSITVNRSSFKDRIVENVAKAIKAIQEIQIYHTSDEPVVLTSDDRPARKLLEHLDHVLLHGLRHITNGYLKIVSEFSTKSTVKDIKRLANVSTDLGRGRAWLSIALNEGLMESYFRCFEGNIKLVKRSYVRDALVLDQQRLNVLITLISGIELVVFQLDYDVPYLDLGTALPQRRSRADSEESESDRLSLCSMDSVASNASKNMIISRNSPVIVDDEDRSHSTQMNGYLGQIDENIETKFDRLDSVMTEDIEPEDTSIEIIHVKRGSGKAKKTKGKKNKKEPVIGTVGTDEQSPKNSNVKRPNELTLDLTTAEVQEQYEHIENLEKDVKPFYKLAHSVKEDDLITPDEPNHLKSHSLVNENPPSCLPDEEKTDFYDKSLDISEKSVSDDGDNFIEDDYIQECTNPIKPCDNDQFAEKVIKKFQNKHNVTLSMNGDFYNSGSKFVNKADVVEGDVNELDNNTHKSAIFEHPGNGDVNTTLKEHLVPKIQDIKPINNHENDNSIHKNELQPTKEKTDHSTNQKSSTSQMQDLVDSMINNQSDIQLKHHMYEEEPEDTNLNESMNKSESLSEGELKLDNNTLLYLMLDVFDNSEEQFVKIFATTQGHTDGECIPVFLTLTDRSIYFLSQKQSDHRFYKDISIPFSSVDFINLGINGQSFHVVCTNRRNQYWITTGNQVLTKAIIDCITTICNQSRLTAITVYDDATTQKIALKKYINKECPNEDTTICCYSLVHWDTPSTKGHNPEKLHREGHLLYKLHEPPGGLMAMGSQYLQNPVSLIYGQSWKPAYVELKDGLLCIYNDKNDSKPVLFVQIGGEECSGCRRAKDTDRDHCIQIIKSDESSIQLALASGLEASDWLQSLCQAVAEGIDSKVTEKMGCMACCLVMSQHKLLMCHEDLQSSFYRTLGSANVIDVTSVLEDPNVKTYLVLVFESHDTNVSNEQWVLHFNSEQEKLRFIKSLSDCWKTHFEVEIPVFPVDDFALMKICQEMALLLKNKLTIKKS